MKLLISNILIIYLVSMMSIFASPKNHVDSSNTKIKSNIFKIDSVHNIPSLPVEKAESKIKYTISKSPTQAILYSLLLPGMGQLYVESYWKVPLFVGASGTLIYLIVDNNKKFNNLEKQWKILDDTDPNKSRLKLEKEYYRDQRDMDAFYLFGVYVISAIDAYVGAHLYDFNVSDNLALHILPNSYNGIMLQMKISW